MNEERKYKEHINGLKGFACLMVMIGHFIGLYKYAENFPIHNAVLDTFLSSKLSFIINETYWVNLFFIISGYLVAMSKINNVQVLAKKAILRFLRLGIPVLFASFIIWIMQESIGFYTVETSNLFTNTWIQKNYLQNFYISDVLLSPVNVLILGRVGINGPYWVLRDMFIASIMIYILTWMKNKLQERECLFYISSVCFLELGFVISRIVCACLLGMFLMWGQENYQKIIKEKWFPYLLMFGTIILYFISRAYISFIFFAVLIIFIPKTKLAATIFTSKIATFCGRISFGIYSFHWPVLCSIGMIIILKTSKMIGLLNATILSMGISMIFTIAFSIVFNVIIEKNVSKLLKKI